MFDLRTRLVPVWLTGGGIAAGVLLAAWAGPPALLGSLAGAAVGGLVFLPFVWRGWLGGADALLLAAVGAWQGWRVALWAAWWTALAGAVLALGRLGLAGAPVPARGARLPLPAGREPAGATGQGQSRPPGPPRQACRGRSGRGEPVPYVPAILAARHWPAFGA